MATDPDSIDKILLNRAVLRNLLCEVLYRLTDKAPVINMSINKEEKVSVLPDSLAISYREGDSLSPCQTEIGQNKHPEPACISGVG